MLTGRPPFKAATRELTIVQLLTQEPVPPTRLNAAVPAELEAVCLTGLDTGPSNRYPAAGDLADDLRRFLDGAPVSVRPVGEWERAGLWAKRAGYEILDVSGASVLGLVYTARQVQL